jgi:outer membrane immunogenic protein
MKKFLLATVALSALVAAPAMAADLARPVPVYKAAPPVVYAYSWTGCYVGGNAGGVWVNKDYSLTSVGLGAPFAGAVAFPAIGLGSHTASSGIGGVQVGCNYQFAGGWVVGIQGDYDWTRANGSHLDPFGGLTTLSSNTKSLGSVTGRIGYAWDRFLGYVKGGGAWERDRYDTYFGPLTTTPGTTFSTASETRSGWTVGVGGEYVFWKNLSAFLEYDYYDFGTKTNSFTVVTTGAIQQADIRERKSVVKAGLNWKFDWAQPVVAKY